MSGSEDDDWAQARTVEGSLDALPPGSAITSPSDELRRRLEDRGRAPTRVGRFFIQREIGAGGMGAVFAGVDPDLDRKVAVKLVEHDASSVRARARLRREAQALAQLSHPNIVPVYEVGEHEGSTFVAMELVVGADLQAWLLEREHDWREIVEIFVQAGEGLYAAHQAGLVHRDFKPHNVLVGDDGRVRVVDFGLATDDAAGDASGELGEDAPVTDSLTRTDDLLGTPAYMAPEQFSGQRVRPAADQFAFCVALYEALSGDRPFDGYSVHTLAATVLRDPPVPLPKGPWPDTLRPVLARGLSRDPEARYPDMRALLDALHEAVGEASSAAGRTNLVLAAATVVLAVSLGVVLVWPALSSGGGSASGRARSDDAAPSEPSRDEPIARAVPPSGAGLASKSGAMVQAVAEPRAPDGDGPSFEALAGPRAAEAVDAWTEGCKAFRAGELRAAARSFALAADAYARAGGDELGTARIQYARALAHRAAFDRDGVPNDLRVAYELLLRLRRAAGTVAADRTIQRAVRAYEVLAADGRLRAAGIDPEVPTRFSLAWLGDGEPGAEVTIDGEIVGHEPVTGAVPFDGGGHIIISRHARFYDSLTVWNPRTPEEDVVRRSPMNLVPPGQTRSSGGLPALPGMVELPETITTPDDWPRAASRD